MNPNFNSLVEIFTAQFLYVWGKESVKELYKKFDSGDADAKKLIGATGNGNNKALISL